MLFVFKCILEYTAFSKVVATVGNNYLYFRLNFKFSNINIIHVYKFISITCKEQHIAVKRSINE